MPVPLSCEQISRRSYSMREAARQQADHGLARYASDVDVRLLDLIDALNQHHFIIATALREISEHEPGAITIPTFRKLSQMLMGR